MMIYKTKKWMISLGVAFIDRWKMKRFVSVFEILNQNSDIMEAQSLDERASDGECRMPNDVNFDEYLHT